jgi:hypothetical protein
MAGALAVTGAPAGGSSASLRGQGYGGVTVRLSPSVHRLLSFAHPLRLASQLNRWSLKRREGSVQRAGRAGTARRGACARVPVGVVYHAHTPHPGGQAHLSGISVVSWLDIRFQRHRGRAPTMQDRESMK